MKTKILSLLLCLCLVFSVFAFASCGKDGNDTEAETSADGTGTGEGEGNKGNESSEPLKGKDAFYAEKSTISQLLNSGIDKDAIKNMVHNINFKVALDESLLGEKTELEYSSSSLNDTAKGSISLGYGSEKGTVDLIATKDGYYIGGGNLLNKYIKLDADTVNVNIPVIDSTALATSIEKLVSDLKKYCDTAFSADKYVDSTETTTLDGKEITLNVVTLSIASSDIKSIAAKYIELIKADNTIIDFVCSASGEEKDIIFEGLDEAIGKLNGEENDDNTAKIAIKLYNNVAVGADVSVISGDEGMKFAYDYLIGDNSDEGNLEFEVTDEFKLNLTYKKTDKNGKPVYSIALNTESTETDYEMDENAGDFVMVNTPVNTSCTAVITTTNTTGTKTEYAYEVSIKPGDEDATKFSGNITADKKSNLAVSCEASVKIENSAMEAPISLSLSFGYEYAIGVFSVPAIGSGDVYTSDEDTLIPEYYTDLITNLSKQMPNFITVIGGGNSNGTIDDGSVDNGPVVDATYAESLPNFIG